MLRNFFPSPTSDLSLEDALELANKYLSNARKEGDSAKALEHTNNVKSLLKHAEHILASKKDKDPTLSEGIANAYHEHAQLLDGLGHHDKAKKSHSKAVKWRYVDMASQHTAASQSLGKSGTETAALSFTPNASTAMYQVIASDATQLNHQDHIPHPNPVEINNGKPTPNKDVVAFIREELEKPSVVSEVVSLAAILGQDDFRKLLQTFVDGISQSVLLDVHLLNGLARLVGNAPQGYIDADDLVKILELLNARLKDTHKQPIQHTYQLAQTISQVLDSMVDSQVEGLSRDQLHKPLSDYLKGLQQNPDPYLVYQAVYAYQTLQYIPDDETILQSMMRRAGKVVRGISGVISAVKALDVMGFIEGLQSVQQGLAGAEKAIGLVSDVYSNAMTLNENGQELMTSLKESFNFKRESSWYPALRGLDRLVQEAGNTIWDLKIRKCAVNFLIHLYKDDASKGQQINVKQRILCILNKLSESSKDIIDDSVQELLQEVQANSSTDKGILYHEYGNDNSALHRIMAAPPPTESPLLDCVQNKPDVETPLRQLKLERLKDRGGDVYISSRAKATPRAKDDFDLTDKVTSFLPATGSALGSR
ncbi:hypothetical protein BGZ80_005384 [Entomortierella chlamydospora]|uniref:Arm-like repeat domain-containing protein n=1 Tax=Entomortierella chlamydospora TaxID=101097 RepID=A0A9P6MJW6_9FUNG|nr:hypothetical protein BGZ80_005384 [Entomortierella chlamydospora]